MVWDRSAEYRDPESLRALQLQRLQELVTRLYIRVPFYRRKFDEAGIRPSDINSLEDISKIPFTTKQELRETYPYGLLAVDESEIVEVHTSSGTTGTPVVGAYTRRDIETWSHAMARTLAMAGAGPGDVIQNAYGYGLFTGGLGVHYGARMLGANVIPISAGNTKRQLMIMRDFGTTLLTCTPSYSLFLAETAAEEGIDFRSLPLKAGCFGAEPWSDNMRREIENKLSLTAHDIYGLTEIIGPGVAAECEVQDGLHINEDFFYPEIINPETGEVLPPGEKGELVFTTLTKEGTPILRYRTRDITYLYRETCSCGRTTIKMHRLLGRTDDMLIIRGVNIFPSQIEEVLIRIEETQPHYQIVVDRGSTHLDEVEIRVEVEESFFSDETKGLERIRSKISEEIRSSLGIGAIIRLVEPKSLERSIGKATRVIDKRQI
ncbi:phenylacetate--CoA ligase [Marispirochaeta aestuarii]|uniref:Phenylacetate-coenzyme A ligase n=1 Tax=Marispirochaeta aestuarii TaxID=1963862 RepID=A0A1Y1S1B2_9SPIO|nr:phenylacetate--CoA ligase [Marispirochaeta aestuarii]ORC36550.1 phenylacetate--CoA ligase [Marispirochaeta aestuarii]